MGVTLMFWLNSKVGRMVRHGVCGRTDRCKAGGQLIRE